MADDSQPERNVNIHSTVSVGTATDQTTVSGARVSVGSAREVNIHNPPALPLPRHLIVLTAVLALLEGALINVATSQLPASWTPYLWLSWPLLILVTAISIWVAYRQGRTAEGSVVIAATPDARSRAVMLDKVEKFWVKGVLEQSLYQIARLELGLEQAPEKIDHPWATVLQQATSKRAVPAGTRMVDLFDELSGTMLILGAPGAGKTTLLLELARDLIARTRNNEQYLLPLVFNLSTWASKRRPLKEWLAEELNQRYGVPPKLAAAWVEADAIVPLLDGLDEVAADQRDACVEAINAYRQERGLVPLAVCSREEAYAEIADKLKLQGAIVIQPLPKKTVDGYLRQVGRPLAAVRAALRDDPTLWELMDTPLMLSIVALAYKGRAPAKLRTTTKIEERRQLFDDYITGMFERVGRSGGTAPYTKAQTTRWLSWLAGQMVAHSLTVYYIERMQLGWMSEPQQRHYARVVLRSFGLLGGLVGGLIFAPRFGLISVLLGGLVGGLAGVLVGEGRNARPVETLYWSWSAARNQLGGALVFGLVCGLGFGVVGGVVGGVAGGPVGRFVFGLGFGVVGGVVGGVVFGLVGGLIGGLSFGELETKTRPNQGIWRSSRFAAAGVLVFGVAGGVVFGLVFGLVGGLIGGLIGGLPFEIRDVLIRERQAGLVFDLDSGLVGGLVGGLVFGLIGGLYCGGMVVIQHYTLRWILARNSSLPLPLVPFLDYCAERIFLRKVGGGYIFVHRLLMEQFASMDIESLRPRPRDGAAD